MNKLLSFSRLLVFLIAGGLSAFLQQAQAQTQVIVGTGTSSTSTASIFSTSTTTNKYSKNIAIYSAADILAAGGMAGNITKIAWQKGGTGEYTTNDIALTVSIKAVPFTTHASSPVTFATEITGATQVFSSTTYSFMTGTGWNEINLQTPFLWDGISNLEVFVDFYRPGTPTGSIDWLYTTTTNANASQVSGTAPTTAARNNNLPNLRLTIIPATPCTAPPTPGIATSNITTICAGANFNLNLTGTSFGSGQTYQWESSANGTTGWTPAGTAANTPFLTTSQTAGTHYYRAAVTCSGQTAYSTVVSVTSPALVSGTFTINGSQPTSATNFQTFADAINSLACGIGGPVTFNVAAGTYNEQVVIPAIGGMSTANPIVFNGNNATLSSSPVTGSRAMVRLDGASYVTISNLNIVTTGTGTSDYGWGIHFTNEANNNTISNNTINIGSLSTTESNSIGIVFSSSTTSVTTTGGNNGNNNIISGNTIRGGYNGIILHGTASNPGNNQIVNNIIKDFYQTGIEINGIKATLAEGNTISRPTRATVGTFYGIYLAGAAQNSVVSKNRIHNTHGGATSVTGAAYGIYSTSNDAPASSENIVKNNVIYNFTGTGTVNGIYNSGSDGIYYYYNTILLDNAASTGVARGFYQTTLASNIKLVNNNVVVSTGGTATNQHAIYLNTATTTLESNRNNLFVPNGNIGYHSTTQYATLANWQTANNAIYDLNSVSADPIFVNVSAGNLQPSNIAMNNIAQPLAAITDDITGAVRNITTPDPGAYEFTPASLDLGATALTAPATQNCYSNAEPVTVTIQNFGTSPIDFSTVTANVTVTITGAATPAPLVLTLTNAMNGGQPLAPGATMNVTAGTVNMTIAGTYTFNATTNVTSGGSDGNALNNAIPASNVVVAPLAAGTASATNPLICLSGVTTLNLTGATGGNIQWQQGTAATGPFTNITGATTASFTLPAAITQTTYYRAVVSCGTNSANSNAVTVTVNTPTAPTVAAVSRCGAGPVTLNATAPAGSTINWYNAATGGSALGTGASFTTNVTATSTLYASQTDGGSTQKVGIVNGGTSTYITSTTGWGLRFTANSAVTINSVNVYANGTGTITIKITDLSDNVLYTAQPVTITGATTTQKTLVPVNLAIAPGNYKMGMTYTGITTLVRESSGVSFPYTSPSGAVSITAGANGAGTANTTSAYYWFYDWTVTTGCESTRTPVTVTIDPKPAKPTITRGGTGNMQLTSSATTGNQWLLNSQPIAGATAQTYLATASGTYAVVVTGSNGCVSDTSAAVNISTTSVKDALAGMSVNVYPNPTSGKFNVKLTGYKQEATIELYSLTGQLIVREAVKAGQEVTPMQVKNLAAGAYLLKVISEKGVQINKVIVE